MDSLRCSSANGVSTRRWDDGTTDTETPPGTRRLGEIVWMEDSAPAARQMPRQGRSDQSDDITMTPSKEFSLRTLAAPIQESIPAFCVQIANANALRGKTAKGDYEIRVFIKNHEVRTTYLRKGGNPLKDIRLIARTNVNEGENGLAEHVTAIARNEQKLPLILKETNRENGDEFVTILPFGDASDSARIIVRTSSRTGIVSMDVRNAHELSPAEAKLLGKAITQACRLAAGETETPGKS